MPAKLFLFGLFGFSFILGHESLLLAKQTEKDWTMLSYTQRIETLFNNLNKDSMHLLEDFYDPQVEFVDPVGEHSGLDSLRKYYQEMYKNVKSIEFAFGKHLVDENRVSSPWTMKFQASGVAGGEQVVVSGMSIFEFSTTSDKVIYHRDYFDMGSFIYEHVPVLRSIISFIKGKLKTD